MSAAAGMIACSPPAASTFYRVKADDWEGRKNIAKTFGFIFFGTGLVLLALIAYAMISRLGH